MDSKIVCFCLIFMQCSVQIQSLECPQCVDVKSSFYGMQNEMESVMKNTLKQVEDILCRTNQAEPAACSVATSGRANKCANVFETMVMNIKGHAGASIKYEIISRGCTPRPIGEADKCIDITDSEEYNPVSHILETLKQQNNIDTINGEICYQSPSFANKVHVSNVLYIISIMFSLKLFV